MKTPTSAIILIMIATVFLISSPGTAAQKSSQGKKAAAQTLANKKDKTKNRLKQDVSFDEHAVGGKYQMPLESTTVVEDEKSLDDLIGVRQNFKDRSQVSQELR